MIFFGHMGVSLLVGQGINEFLGDQDRKHPSAKHSLLDLRVVAILSIVPDLIDKPLALIMGEEFGYHTRLFGHSLVLSLLVLIWLLAIRSPHRWMLWGFYLGHLLIDRVWVTDKEYFFWPFLDAPAPLAPTHLNFFQLSSFHPDVLNFEFIALYLTLGMAMKYRLFRRDEFMEFVNRGTLGGGLRQDARKYRKPVAAPSPGPTLGSRTPEAESVAVVVPSGGDEPIKPSFDQSRKQPAEVKFSKAARPKSVLLITISKVTDGAQTSAMLRTAGYEVERVASAELALDALAVLPKFGVAVCDTASAVDSKSALALRLGDKQIPLITLEPPFNDEELLRGVEILCGDHRAPGAAELAEEGFAHVAIDAFLSSKTLQYDIFIRISGSKYLKIANKGDGLPKERIDSYKAKGVQFLFLNHADFMKYLGFSVALSQSVAAKGSIPLEKRVKLVAQTEEIILSRLFIERITEKAVDSAKSIVESSVLMLTSEVTGYQLLDILRSHDERLYAHSVGVSFYAVLIARQLGWTSPDEVFKVAICGLLHDLGKKELDIALIEKTEGQCSPAELKILETHTGRGVEILKSVAGVPDELMRVIAEHHENPVGLGYPAGLRLPAIHPLARLISVADDFCYRALRLAGDEAIDIEKTLASLWKLQQRLPDQQYFSALTRVFRVRVNEKTGGATLQ